MLTMAMRQKIGRLFRIETRFEAWLVIYAIAVGSVERGQHYMTQYPGFGGWLLAAACTGVVFIAGAKLLDSVKPKEAVAAGSYVAPLTRNRPTIRRSLPGSESRPWHRTGSRPATPPRVRRAASLEDQTRSPDY
jgi:hypothetical protein